MSCMEKCAWVKGLLSPFLFFTPKKETQIWQFFVSAQHRPLRGETRGAAGAALLLGESRRRRGIEQSKRTVRELLEPSPLPRFPFDAE